MKKTAAEALEALQQVVAEFGDGYVYPPEFNLPESGYCVYATPDGTPRCIVGHVLNRWNLLDQLKRDDGTDYWNPNIEGPSMNAFLNSEAQRILRRAQVEQDQGFTWGEALVKAKEFYEELCT